MSKRYKQKRRERYYLAQYIAREVESEGPCWCGETNPYYAPLPATCGGSGTIDCHCGGDLCVCHWHGEVECFGCEDCQHENGLEFSVDDEADDPDEDRICD